MSGPVVTRAHHELLLRVIIENPDIGTQAELMRELKNNGWAGSLTQSTLSRVINVLPVAKLYGKYVVVKMTYDYMPLPDVIRADAPQPPNGWLT